MKTILALSLVGAAAALAPAAAQAQSYSSTFANLGTQGDGAGYYYFTGHTASELFAGTGLSSVTGLDLNLVGGSNGNYVTQPLSLTFEVNGVSIGSTTYNPGDSANRMLNFVFGSIASGSTDYTLSAFVSGPVCSGCGAVQFGTTSSFTLNSTAAVPEPATWAMMLLGFGAVGFGMRRQRKSARLVQVG